MSSVANKEVPKFGFNTPVMNIRSIRGDKVVFLGINGYPGELKAALELLTVGGIYEVSRVDVYSSSSTVYLYGIGVGFNTVMFGPLSVLDKPKPSETDFDVWKAHFDKLKIQYTVGEETEFNGVGPYKSIATDEGFTMTLRFNLDGSSMDYGAWK